MKAGWKPHKSGKNRKKITPSKKQRVAIKKKSAAAARADLEKEDEHGQISKDMVIRLNAEQCSKLRIPIGCPVWYNFSREGGKCGVTKSASLRGNSQLFYEVTYIDEKDNSMTEEVEDKHLVFGVTTPVTISSSNHSDENTPLEGEILLCTPSSSDSKFVYTAMIFLEGSRVRYENGIEAERVKYRKVKRGDEAVNDDTIPLLSKNSVSVSAKKDDCSPEASALYSGLNTDGRWRDASYHTASGSGTFLGKCFNCGGNHRLDDCPVRHNDATIKANRAAYKEESKVKVDTAPRKVKHPNKEHPSLQILVPLWLQKDRESQKNLFNHLLGSNERRRRGYNMRKICKETQCRVSIDWDEEGDSLIPMIINIFDPKTAAEKRFNCLQRARRMIQHLLLEFVGNDGSQGRLVYEIASSCSGSHRPTKSTSNAVREINPLSHDVRSVFMSIIDLPYDYVEHHSLRQVEAFGCQLNIVAAAHQFTDGFTTTNLCDPYVLVSEKKNYENVDKAVKMLKTMISES